MAWIAQPAELTSIREDLLVKLQASYLSDPEVILAELWRRHRVHADRLGLYCQQQQGCFPHPEALSRQEKCSNLTLERGIRYEAEWIAWCDEAIATLDNSS